MNILGPVVQRTEDCEAVLRSLPKWFGMEKATVMYAADTATMPTFAMELDGQIIAFLTLREHFPAAWEIHCMAVSAHVRGRGYGSALLGHVEGRLVARSVKFLQVKTVAATSKSVEHAETRKFYESRGFTPVEVFPELWDPWNPALQCIKRLHAA